MKWLYIGIESGVFAIFDRALRMADFAYGLDYAKKLVMNMTRRGERGHEGGLEASSPLTSVGALDPTQTGKE